MDRTRFICLTLILSCVSLSLFGQVEVKIFYNQSWEIVEEENRFYYRIATVEDPTSLVFDGKVSDYFKNGKLEMEGNYSEGRPHGQFSFYSKDEVLRMQGTYNDGIRTGRWDVYYANGLPKISVDFQVSTTRIIALYTSDGDTIDLSGSKQIQFDVTTPEFMLGRNNAQLSGTLKSGYPEGNWIYTGKREIKIFSEKYKKGAFISGKVHLGANSGRTHIPRLDKFSADGRVPEIKFDITENFTSAVLFHVPGHPNIYFADPTIADAWKKKRSYEIARIYGNTESSSTTSSTSSTDLPCNPPGVFTIVEDQPSFNGGTARFYQYIAQNIKYPSQARRMGIQGKVFVQFVILANGSVASAQVVKGIGAGCDEEAARLIKNSPKWNPGKQKGEPICVRMILPITFKLS